MMSVLAGLKIIEIEGIGPAPFCGMHLADLGAEVVVIERPGAAAFGDIGDKTITKRGKQVIKLDLKKPAHKEQLLQLVSQADGLIEGMRPGVMERLGLGPEVCHSINPRLVFGRVTGWGQSGPLAQAAGHDINYNALSGALWYSGRPGDPPFATPTLIGDIAGGALYLTIGMLGAIIKARATGQGDVVDAAMVDGTAHMMNLIMSLRSSGGVKDERGQSMLDGPHWFDTYECSDGKFVSVGALEPHFYALLLEKLDLTEEPIFQSQSDRSQWPAQKSKLATLFKTKSREEWTELLEGTDVCFAPVNNPSEAAEHPHMKARGAYFERDGILQAAPAPKFARSINSEKQTDAFETTVAELLKGWNIDAHGNKNPSKTV
jgi:crotonobetainyl-CoA:carnitine CoA-transferase CaiB-like acyl-CoA transferase